MATAAWPGTLPQSPKYGFGEKKQVNVNSFTPDVGVPIITLRSTAACWNTTATFEMNDTQLAAFLTFYETTLKDGSLPFTWNHPRTAVNYTWIFDPDSPPQIVATTINFNSVDCKLVRLP
jgi:hypothetical protein